MRTLVLSGFAVVVLSLAPLQAQAPKSPEIRNLRNDLDLALRQLYQVSPRAAEFRNRQDRWLRDAPQLHGNGPAPPALVEKVRNRIGEIGAWTESTKTLLSKRFALDEIARQCIAVPPPEAIEIKGDCRVEEFGRVGGDANLRYQIVTHQPKGADGYWPTSGEPANTTVFFSATNLEHFEIVAWSGAYGMKPYTVEWVGSQEILVLPAYAEGSGGFAYDNAFLRDRPENAWREIDVNQWRADLDRGGRLPPGLATSHGHTVDYRNAIGEVLLARPGEPNCCPTGGKVVARLVIRERRLTIETMTIVPISR